MHVVLNGIVGELYQDEYLPYQSTAVASKSGVLTSVLRAPVAGMHVDDQGYIARPVLRITADGKPSSITFRRGLKGKEEYTVSLKSGQVKHEHTRTQAIHAEPCCPVCIQKCRSLTGLDTNMWGSCHDLLSLVMFADCCTVCRCTSCMR